jgi:hypothetical protein
MGYKLLGWVTWNGVKLFVRQKYGSTKVPVPVLAGAVVAAALGVALAVRHSTGESSE